MDTILQALDDQGVYYYIANEAIVLKLLVLPVCIQTTHQVLSVQWKSL